MTLEEIKNKMYSQGIICYDIEDDIFLTNAMIEEEFNELKKDNETDCENVNQYIKNILSKNGSCITLNEFFKVLLSDEMETEIDNIDMIIKNDRIIFINLESEKKYIFSIL